MLTMHDCLLKEHYSTTCSALRWEISITVINVHVCVSPIIAVVTVVHQPSASS